MNSTDEIRNKIKALETARQLIDDELQKLVAHCDYISRVESESTDAFSSGKATRKIAVFFRECGYRIVDCKTQLPSDVPYLLAKQLWKCYSCTLPLLQQLFKIQTDFTYSIESLSTDDRTSLLNFCKSMATQNWITYARSKNILSIKPSIPKEYRNFLNGGWAEAVNRFLIFRTLTAFSKETSISHKVFWNVCLKKIGSVDNNLHDMELDIVVELNGHIYIFETKSGQVLCVDKWIDRARLFNRTNCRFITCCIDEKINPKNFQPYKLFALQSLERQLTDLLKKDFSSTAHA